MTESILLATDASNPQVVGAYNFTATAEAQANHPIEVTGKKLRGMMDWIDTEF